MKRLWLLVIVLLTSLSSSPASARPNELAEAKRLFRAGAKAYDAGQFAAAVQAFDQAYELSPRAPLRFSAAQALKRQYTTERDPALLRKAQRYYREYTGSVKKGRRVKDAV
jgi:outer membrane protein assembly factor BamD (BamD/ComL family)